MKQVTVNDSMQKNYKYTLQEPTGKNFAPDFKPQLAPKEMLKLGVFGGSYFDTKQKELPKDWFKSAKLSEKEDNSLNFFKIKASQSRSAWVKKGWIYKEDPRGWFQWYCRYFLGRRIPPEDERQIKRWKAIKRHVAQIEKNCKAKDLNCRPKQRQALLHWAYDSRKI